VAEGDFVIAHGRFSGNGRPAAWIVADVVRIEDRSLLASSSTAASRLRSVNARPAASA
jgi:hypothetical protein